MAITYTGRDALHNAHEEMFPGDSIVCQVGFDYRVVLRCIAEPNGATGRNPVQYNVYVLGPTECIERGCSSTVGVEREARSIARHLVESYHINGLPIVTTVFRAGKLERDQVSPFQNQD